MFLQISTEFTLKPGIQISSQIVELISLKGRSYVEEGDLILDLGCDVRLVYVYEFGLSV